MHSSGIPSADESRRDPLELTRLSGNCTNGVNCPTVYARDDGALIVQGYTGHTDLDLPAGEAAVTIPAQVLLDAADALRAAQ